MKNIKYIACGLLTLMLSLGSCSDNYLETNPTDKISDATAYSSLQNLYTCINGIQRKMVSQDGSVQGMGGEPGFIICREALGDDMNFQTINWHKGVLQWVSHRDENSYYCYVPWQIYYGWILNANLVLKHVDEYSNDADHALYCGVKGEALCFRAFCHFNLVQMYAKRYQAGQTNSQLGVPYRVEPNTDAMARNTVEEVYSYINKDLDDAIALLANYTPSELNHFSLEVAYGLKARVALAMQDYATAAQYADLSIKKAEADGHALMKGDQLQCGFASMTSDTNEAMWAAMTQDDQTIYFYSFYAYMSWNFNSSSIRSGVKSISQTTYDLMSPTDLRRAWWDPTGKAGTPTKAYKQFVYQTRKFRARDISNAVGDFTFMRLAEMYLTKAEALAHLGKTAEAQEVLTAFEITRDPSYVSKGNTGDALVQEILTQRRIELWGEGFRWYDLKRLNLPMERTGNNFKIAYCGVLEVPAGDVRWNYAIPKMELNSNNLMVRND